MPAEHVAVLGAGLQGVCAALALAQTGRSVTLVDRAPDCLLRASRVNEGKIHLGHVYANDPSLATSRLMLESALQFAPLLERWVGRPIAWESMRSHPFTYVVANDSMVPAQDVVAHYARLNQCYLLEHHASGGCYLGARPASLWEPSALPPLIDREFAAVAIATPEVSVHPVALGRVLRAAIEAAAGVETLYRHRVTAVTRTSSGFAIEGTGPDGEPWRRSADLVANCLWHGRLEIDRQMGIEPRRPWVYRLKYRVLAELPASLRGLPSLTIVLGAFGDVVTNPHDGSVYLSWYPTCMRGWCNEIATPPAWERRISGDEGVEADPAVVEETLHAFDRIIPGIKTCRDPQAAAGVIFSWGATDIGDPTSHLHLRRDIGVSGHAGYFSIDTGKFTCAPRFAQELVDQLGSQARESAARGQYSP